MATPTDKDTRQFMIYAPDELVRELKIAAAKRDITASTLVRGILQELAVRYRCRSTAAACGIADSYHPILRWMKISPRLKAKRTKSLNQKIMKACNGLRSFV